MTTKQLGRVMVLATACAAWMMAGGCAGSPKAGSGSAGSGPVAIANADFIESFAATSRFTLGRPRSFAFLPDGSKLYFLRSGPREFRQDLYEYDVATGTEKVFLTAESLLGGGDEKLTAEEQARRERMRLTTRGITSFQFSKDGKKMLVPLSGRLFVVDMADGRRTELASKAGGFPIDARFSPDGSLVACVRGDEVYVSDVTGTKEWKVTSGAGGTISNGTAEFVAQEEMGRFEGYWFSPDSRLICFQQTDTAGMEMFSIADPADPAKPVQTWPYPRAGAKNADVKLGLRSVDGSGETTWVQWDRAAYPYVASVKWSRNAPLTVLVQNRLQTEQVLLSVDERTGVTTAMMTERDAAWLNIEKGTPKWLEDGSGFLWVTESYEGGVPGSDFPRLELRNRGGTLRHVVTPAGFPMQELLAVDAARNVAYVTVSPVPTRTGVARIGLAPGSAPEMVIEVPGLHGATFSDDCSVRVESRNPAEGAMEWQVRRVDGTLAGRVESKAESPGFVPRLEVTRVGNLVGEERAFYAAIVRPRTFDASKRYPVIVSVYGGPTSNTVNDALMGYLLQQWYADQGFIVVSVDGRGTPRRGRAWERSVHLDLMTLPLEDQARAVKLLGERYKEMDLSRVGITGWSFGGYFSAMATMRRPDVFKAGVAGAPVCSWEDYDTHYTERYMGLPSENQKGYRAADVLTYCKDLKVPLLIVHGTADDNVYFMHALKMARELFKHGREFEFLPLAGHTHVVADPATVKMMQGRMIGFLKRHLGGATGR